MTSSYEMAMRGLFAKQHVHAQMHARINRLRQVTCERCGSCCRHFIVEADIIDALREPRIEQECKMLVAGISASDLNDVGWLLACGPSRLCPFLLPDGCAIYPTRPSECVAFVPGGKRCAEARIAHGLKPLERNPEDPDYEE